MTIRPEDVMPGDFRPGDFRFIENTDVYDRQRMLSTAYKAMGGWFSFNNYWRAIREGRRTDQIQEAINDADVSYGTGGHSALTMTYTFGAMKRIADVGWETYVAETLLAQREAQREARARTRAERTRTRAQEERIRERIMRAHELRLQEREEENTRRYQDSASEIYENMISADRISPPGNVESDTCVICYHSLFNDPAKVVVALRNTNKPGFVCGHMFHEECIKQWLITRIIDGYARGSRDHASNCRGCCPTCKGNVNTIYRVDNLEERTIDDANEETDGSIIGGKPRKTRRSNSHKKRKTRRSKLGNKAKQHAKKLNKKH